MNHHQGAVEPHIYCPQSPINNEHWTAWMNTHILANCTGFAGMVTLFSKLSRYGSVPGSCFLVVECELSMTAWSQY